ncbi:MAG: hypothetical protein IMZ61_10200 [Planctomycetes bacterium]|nr:hypothetical protein [Planctomycetota bacterium]
MKNQDRFDEELRELVRSVECGIPQAIEEKLRTAIAAPRPRLRKRLIRRPLLLASLSGAAVILLAVLSMIPLLHDRKAPQIAEIRTEFDLADKNIKIIFVQKPDFPVLLKSF